MRLYIACTALLLSLAPIARGLDNEASRSSLKGLKGVGILVEDQKPEVEQNGLATSAIQTDVELKLRQAGIPVLESTEYSKAGSAVLDINVSILPSSDNKWSYAITVQLDQDAALLRKPSMVAPLATTWEVGVFGSIAKQSVRSLRDDVKDLVDKFINAYLAANPKK